MLNLSNGNVFIFIPLFCNKCSNACFGEIYICTTDQPMQLIDKYKLTLLGIAIGALAGYLYYYFVGCASGSCMITSKPLNSTLYGALVGGLMFSSLKKKEVNSKKI